tara:strand:+ start:3743 stop:3943 length:201 start_codon:yes stop_codon:yes gene_type:complete
VKIVSALVYPADRLALLGKTGDRCQIQFAELNLGALCLPVNNYRLYKKKDLMVLLKKLEKPVTHLQ